MVAIVLPQRWLRQPAFPVEINHGSDVVAAMGVTEVWSPLAGALTSRTNFRKATPVLAGSALAQDAIGRGLDLPTASAGNSLQIATDGDDLFAAAECSILLLRRSKDTTGRASIAFGYDQTAVSRVLAHAPYNDGNLYWDFGNATAGSGRTSVAFTKVTTPEVLTFIASAAGGSPRGREVWRGKTRIVSTTGATATRAATTSAFFLGAAAATASDIETQYLFIAASVAWPAALIPILAENPWQIFKPYRRVIYFEPNIPVGGSVAVTETPDTIAIVAANWCVAQIAVVETPDTIAIAAAATTGAAVGIVESPDTLAIVVASVLYADIAITERPDTMAVHAAATMGASLACTERPDRIAINKPAPAPFAFVRRRYGILLYEPLPLRKSGALGNFADEFILAQRFGDLTSGRFELKRLNDTEFFAADHPMSINQSFIDDQETGGWEARLNSDGHGHTWTKVRFAAPVAPGSIASATGTGKRNPRTGALLENAADIVEDIGRLAGRDDRWWDQLRGECAKAGLRLAGSLDTEITIRAAYDAVLMSAGAIWVPGMARLYPCDVSGYVGELDKQKVSNLVVSAGLPNTADILRLYYDPDKASGKNQHYIEVTANPAIYGGLPATLSFDWLRSPANAESVAKRVLPWLAGERYDVAFDCGDPTVRPGMWVRLVAHPEWPFDGDDPIVMILEAVVTPGSNTVACAGETIMSAPAAIVTAHSVALPATRGASVDVRVTGGNVTLIVSGEDGRPLYNARVSLDDGPSKKSTANGEVSFAVQTEPGNPKQHRLAIQAPGNEATVQKVWL